MLGLSPGSRFATDLQICQHNLKSGNLQCMRVEEFGVKGGRQKEIRLGTEKIGNGEPFSIFPNCL